MEVGEEGQVGFSPLSPPATGALGRGTKDAAGLGASGGRSDGREISLGTGHLRRTRTRKSGRTGRRPPPLFSPSATGISGGKRPSLPFCDRHVERGELKMPLALGRAMAAREGGEITGWLRWDLLWDNTPFLNLLSVVAGPRGRNGAARLLRGTDKRGRAPAGADLPPLQRGGAAPPPPPRLHRCRRPLAARRGAEDFLCQSDIGAQPKKRPDATGASGLFAIWC